MCCLVELKEKVHSSILSHLLGERGKEEFVFETLCFKEGGPHVPLETFYEKNANETQLM